MMKGCLFYVGLLAVIVLAGATYVDQRFLPKHVAGQFFSEYKTAQESTMYSESERIYPKARDFTERFPGKIKSYSVVTAEYEKIYLRWSPQPDRDLPQARIKYRVSFTDVKYYDKTEKNYVVTLQNETPNNPFKPDWVILELNEEE